MLYIYAAGVEKEIIKKCLKKRIKVKGYFYDSVEVTKDKVCEDEYYQLADAKMLIKPEDVVVVCSDFGGFVLQNRGISKEQIICIYSRVDKGNKRFFKYFRILEHMQYYSWSFGERHNFKWLMSRFTRWHDRCVVSFLKRIKKQFYILYDGDDYVDFSWIEEHIKKWDYFKGVIKADIKKIGGVESYKIDYEKLLYSDMNDIFVCLCCNRNRVKKIEGYLLNIGIPKENILMLYDVFYHAMAEPYFEYDVHLGAVHRQEKNPGFVTFGNEDEKTENTIRLLTLGGSTSDPTYGNYKSWSEIIYDTLTERGMNVLMYAGGVSQFTANHEWIKCTRDGVRFKPDLVISYSGFNNATTMNSPIGYPSIRNQQMNFLKSNLLNKSKKIRRKWEGALDQISGGIAYKGTLAAHWLECERVMHSVCSEFGIDFYGFLQPYNKTCAKEYWPEKTNQELEMFYSELAGGGWEREWLVDFTGIFSKMKDTEAFFDICHQYERSNRIIAKRMMPYILRSLEKRGKA